MFSQVYLEYAAGEGGGLMLYEKLNERKKELGLTTEQLSRLSGVPVGTINKVLSGETRSPRYATLRALEGVLYGAASGESPDHDYDRNIYGTESGQADSLWVKAGDEEYRRLPDAVREAAAPYVTKRQGEYTADDYRNLPEDVRAELIDGVLIFLEAPTFTHQELITELLFEIKMYIRENKGPCRVLPSPLDVQLDCDDRTIVQPDIALICRDERITRKGIYGAPDFCVEVVSDSSRKRDYGIKMQKYMNAGVREYWIVDRKRKKIVCYWFEGEDAPEISMYTFKDKVPVRVYDGELEIDFPGIQERLWKEI